MTELERIHIINKAMLSGTNYFTSLLTQGRQCALISDSDVERIQSESLTLLATQTEKWSRGKSSSIRVEKAQELLSSILYTVGIALKAYPSPEDAVDALKQEPLEQLFQAGLKRIRRKVQTARLIHRQITKDLFQTKNVFYCSTVVDGIGGFFKLYSSEFSAQEIHITADYPTFPGVADLAGIEFIERYLRNIARENQFLLYFSANKIHHLLCGLDENYQQILMNLYEPVLAVALGCALTKRPVLDLSCDMDALEALFHGKSTEEIKTLLSAALNQVIVELDCSHELTSYLKSSLPKLALSIQNAMEQGHLETVVLTPSYPEDKPQIILSYGDRMDDRDYAKVLDELLWCESAEKKAEIILRDIHSLGDLLEILRDSEPTQEELVEMLRRFPPEIIAVLLRQYPNDDFLTDDREITIYSALQELCAALTETARAQMERAVQTVGQMTMFVNEQVKKYVDQYPAEIIDLFNNLRRMIFDGVSCELEEVLWAKLPSYCVGRSFVRLIPFKDHINVEAQAVISHKEEFADYTITPKGMLQIYLKQDIPSEILKQVFAETLER